MNTSHGPRQRRLLAAMSVLPILGYPVGGSLVDLSDVETHARTGVFEWMFHGALSH